MKYVSKQELKSVPFQVLHEKVTIAGRKAVDNLVKLEKDAHSRLITRKEQEWSDTHESPYEGNFDELYPFSGPSDALVKKERIQAEQDAMKDAIKLLGLKEKASWLLPQITAYIAKMPLSRNEKGLIDGSKFLDNFKTDDWHKGLYRYCTVFQRGLIVPSQYSMQYKNYSALVPLLMMPFKKMDGIKYEQWDKDTLANVLDISLYAACVIEPNDLQVAYSSGEILNCRNKGLIYQSGDKKDTSRNPVSAFKLYGLKQDSEDNCEVEIACLPWLSQVMNTQIWVAHPSIRTELMILNPEKWDNMPCSLIDKDPLVKEEVMGKDEESISTKYVSELDWLS